MRPRRLRYINQDELKAVFDQQASGYEKQQMKLAPIHDGLYFQLEWIFSELPQTAQILCVGLGTGSELSYLASRFPKWRFTAVEPSTAMLDVCRQRAEKEGYISRCRFHEGYLESLPDVELHDAATCFMVSQFILEKVWVSMLHAANAPAEAIEKTHAAWAKDVAILPPNDVRSIIEHGGFNSPVQFYQAGFVHAWFSKRSPGNAG